MGGARSPGVGGTGPTAGWGGWRWERRSRGSWRRTRPRPAAGAGVGAGAGVRWRPARRRGLNAGGRSRGRRRPGAAQALVGGRWLRPPPTPRARSRRRAAAAFSSSSWRRVRPWAPAPRGRGAAGRAGAFVWARRARAVTPLCLGGRLRLLCLRGPSPAPETWGRGGGLAATGPACELGSGSGRPPPRTRAGACSPQLPAGPARRGGHAAGQLPGEAAAGPGPGSGRRGGGGAGASGARAAARLAVQKVVGAAPSRRAGRPRPGHAAGG